MPMCVCVYMCTISANKADTEQRTVCAGSVLSRSELSTKLADVLSPYYAVCLCGEDAEDGEHVH